jgi:hypothetical protein
MKKLLFILFFGFTVYAVGFMNIKLHETLDELFEDKTIVLFEDLRLTPEKIGEENYNNLHGLLNAPTNAQRKIFKILK